MSENRHTEEIISKAIGVLSETFEPAGTIEECARRYTSPEIASAIYKLAGVVVDVEMLYDIMDEYGYRYVVDDTSAGIKYVWLLKYRTR